MGKQTFYDCLLQELLSSRRKLLELYEKKEQLQYVDAPALRREYAKKVGSLEETVRTAEREVSMLKRKAELLQSGRDRREPVDLRQIEEQLNKEFPEPAAAPEPTEPDLPAEDMHTMQRIYHNILANFHPKANPDITDAQRELFSEAMAAYRELNLAELKRISSALNFKSVGGMYLDFWGTPQEKMQEAPDENRETPADYTLAQEVYPCFTELESDTALLKGLESDREESEALGAEIDALLKEFPFSAQELLHSQEKMAAYLEQLHRRKKQCADWRAEWVERLAALSDKIREM